MMQRHRCAWDKCVHSTNEPKFCSVYCECMSGIEYAGFARAFIAAVMEKALNDLIAKETAALDNWVAEKGRKAGDR